MNENYVVVGLQHGDEGKGKVCHVIARRNEIDCYVRFNGGPNAGHTVYIEGEKVVIHQIPVGIFSGKPCLISTGCVIDMTKLDREIKQVEKFVPNVRDLLHLSKYAHVILDENIQEDSKDREIGTTGCGIGPCYVDKVRRIGARIEGWETSLKKVEPFEFLSQFKNVLFEGAQGFEIDLDYGEYPFVTSSNCTVGGIFLNGAKVNVKPFVIGVAKIYETYVGAKEFSGGNRDLEKLQEIGEEYGATTGRKRQVNWLNLDRLKLSCRVNQPDVIIFNKCDILEEVGVFRLIFGGEIVSFEIIDEMKEFIRGVFSNCIFSGNRDEI